MLRQKLPGSQTCRQIKKRESFQLYSDVLSRQWLGHSQCGWFHEIFVIELNFPQVASYAPPNDYRIIFNPLRLRRLWLHQQFLFSNDLIISWGLKWRNSYFQNFVAFIENMLSWKCQEVNWWFFSIFKLVFLKRTDGSLPIRFHADLVHVLKLLRKQKFRLCSLHGKSAFSKLIMCNWLGNFSELVLLQKYRIDLFRRNLNG